MDKLEWERSKRLDEALGQAILMETGVQNVMEVEQAVDDTGRILLRANGQVWQLVWLMTKCNDDGSPIESPEA